MLKKLHKHNEKVTLISNFFIFCVDLDAIKCVSVSKIVKIADLLLFLADCNIVNLKNRQKIKE